MAAPASSVPTSSVDPHYLADLKDLCTDPATGTYYAATRVFAECGHSISAAVITDVKIAQACTLCGRVSLTYPNPLVDGIVRALQAMAAPPFPVGSIFSPVGGWTVRESSSEGSYTCTLESDGAVEMLSFSRAHSFTAGSEASSPSYTYTILLQPKSKTDDLREFFTAHGLGEIEFREGSYQISGIASSAPESIVTLTRMLLEEFDSRLPAAVLLNLSVNFT